LLELTATGPEGLAARGAEAEEPPPDIAAIAALDAATASASRLSLAGGALAQLYKNAKKQKLNAKAPILNFFIANPFLIP
jgi:hypothetical protein